MVQDGLWRELVANGRKEQVFKNFNADYKEDNHWILHKMFEEDKRGREMGQENG